MKTLLAFLFICVITTNIYSQEIPYVNLGVGYPFIIPKTDYSVGEVYGSTIDFFAEFPILIKFKIKPDFIISPGVSYIHLKLTQGNGGGLGQDEYGDYKREAFSIYTKLLYKPSFSGNNNWNFGLVGGYYVYTHVDGIFEWTIFQEGPDYHGFNTIEGNDKSFFKSFYLGFTSSFQFNFKKVRILKPAIELSFYPDFVNIAADFSSYNDVKEHRNMIMVSIILGLGSKGLSIETEK